MSATKSRRSFSRSSARIRHRAGAGIARAALLAACLVWACAGAARAAELQVDAAQRVSLSGSAESLRDTVVELCSAAGVRLVSYDAPDRKLVADYEGVPLYRLLERLLRSESYMVGLERGEEGPRVAWLRVVGTERGGAPVAVASSASAALTTDYFGIGSDATETALSSSNALERAKATRSIIAAIKNNPDELDAFLSRDIGTTANEIADQPFAIDLLNAIKVQQQDQSVRLKLDAIVRTIRVKQAAGNRRD